MPNCFEEHHTGCFPGMTVETSKLEKGASRALFSGIFATGGITLSQVSIMTGLEYYLVQNWVKRGFVSSPKKRVYTKEQFARIVIINMLRETLNIEKICELIEAIGALGVSDDKLYHSYVDMLASEELSFERADSVKEAAKRAALDIAGEAESTSLERVARMIEAMLYAHSASMLRQSAEGIIASIS